jgi:hypothetical protein
MLRLNRLEFRFAGLPRFDVPDILTNHLTRSFDRNRRSLVASMSHDR